jgi:hypothetical protein
MTDIFRHFEICPGIATSDKLLGDEMSDILEAKCIALPSNGSFADLYHTLSQEIHNCGVLKTDAGKVVVPYDLPPPLKRFWVRFLIADHQEVVVHGASGNLRKLHSDEVMTTPPSSAEKKRKATDLSDFKSSCEVRGPMIMTLYYIII